MNLATAVRQAVAGSLAAHLDTPPLPLLIDVIAQDTVILAANRIEAADSPLCNCRRVLNIRSAYDAPPNWAPEYKPDTLDHQCDCAAVTTARRLLEGLARTLHAEQCPGCE